LTRFFKDFLYLAFRGSPGLVRMISLIETIR
jgi:hypothetical protein